MDFQQAKRNRKFDHWIIISLLCSLALGLNFLVSKVEMQVDLTPDSKYSLSKESLALLDKMQNPIDIVITLKDENRLPKIVQKLLHDLNLLLDSFEYAQSARPIRVYRVDVDSPKAPFSLLENIRFPNPISLLSQLLKVGKRPFSGMMNLMAPTLMTYLNLSGPGMRKPGKQFSSPDFMPDGRSPVEGSWNPLNLEAKKPL